MAQRDYSVLEHLRNRIGQVGETMIAEKVRQRQRQESQEDTMKMLKMQLLEKAKEEYLTPEDRANIKLKEAQAKYYSEGGTRLLSRGGGKPQKTLSLKDLAEFQTQSKLQSAEENPNIPMNIGDRIKAMLTLGATPLEKQQIELKKKRASRAEELIRPYTTQYKNQFLPQGGRFTGGTATDTPEVPVEIANEYPEAYQGEDGQWYVDRGGKTYRIKIE